MAFQTITTLVRPNTNVPFFSSTDNKAVKSSYTASGKISANNAVISQDGLTKTVTLSFATQADQLAFKADASRNAVKEARRAYNLANNIAMTVELKSV